MRATLFTSCFAACILFSTSTTLRADPTNAPVQNPRPGFRPLAPTGLNAGQNPGIAGFALGGPVGALTDQQRASYQVTMKELRPKFAELDAKLRAARQDLLDTSVTGKFDENVIRQKALAAAKIEAEMTVLRVKAFSQVQPPLTPEQIEKIKSGQPGPMRTLHRESTTTTNRDDNGLPPKK
jgi:Spy/CpxP family protein refolding chaperone